ncbi:MAG: PAS domain-containing protein [Spirochaetales bacterium]|nr:PAS domain-containing protein [Spirochaetales bacterium]MCF7938288.1 PAS domain-containing protein [Spirochaetales bacterium]
MPKTYFHYDEFIDWLPNPLFIVDNDSNIKRSNYNAAKFLGLSSPEELKGKRLVDFYRYPEEWQILIDRLHDEANVSEFEVIYQDYSEKLVVAVESSFLMDVGNIVIVGRDITTRLELENRLMGTNMELMDANAKLQEMHRQLIQEKSMASLGTLAAGLAHEMNNPLGYIKSNIRSFDEYFRELLSYTQTLEGIIRGSGSDERDASAPKKQNIKRLRSMHEIDQIENDIASLISETDSGIERIVKTVKSLSVFTEEGNEKDTELSVPRALEMAVVLTQADNLPTINYSAKIHKVPPVRGKLKELVQAFINLLLNAIDAAQSLPSPEDTGSNDGQSVVTGRIRIETSSDSEWIYCNFINNGPVIDKDKLGRIFDPFFTTKDVGKGAGLGLTAVYQVIVYGFGGRIDVQSSKEETRFLVRIPQSR